MTGHPLLRIEDLSVDFVNGDERTQAVQHLSLTVRRGEIVALAGESGSGKSVTSMSILRLLPQPPAQYTSGRIIFSPDGHSETDLLHLPLRQMQDIRGNRIAMIFQEPMSSLNPVISIGKQVVEAIQAHQKMSAAEAKQQAISWFEKVKLPHPAQIFNRYPHQLSGGQKQRVMIAMAMSCQPSLLICDEPTTALDVTVQKTILQLIRELQQQQNIGVIFITHDLGVVSEIADRVAILYKGVIVEENTTANIFSQPQHLYTRALIACRPASRPKGERLPVVADFMQPGTTPPITAQSMPAATNDVLVEVQHLSVRFPARTNFLGSVTAYHTAVTDVSFQVFRNETLGLVGESGCGKTTLGRTLLRLIEPSSGHILFRGRDITRLSKKEVVALRRDVQLVFQDPFSSLNPRLTVGDAIAEPMSVSGRERNGRTRKKKVAELLDRVNLPSAVMKRYPHEFSGGQRQRIVIARALALDPQFLVCDESVSALDVSVQAQVLNLLNELKKELGLTMLFISHDLSVVRYMCDRILVMKEGSIVESGEAESIYKNPQTAYTKALIDAIPGKLAANSNS